jgi:pilus assembly protein CpaB
MTRIRVFIVLVLALSAGGVLAYGTYSYMQNANTPAKVASMPTRPVVIATTDLQVGAEIAADDLRTIQWPASSVPEGAFAQPSEVVGRGLIMPIVRNEPVLPSKLASKEEGSGLPPAIPTGMRAVSVRVNEVIGVAGYVLPGTHVDVLATANPTEQPGDITSKVVLTNVQVVTAGTKLEQSGDKGKPVAVSVVTLLVTPEQSERLTLASTEGKIQLALRNPLDKTTPVTKGIKPAALLGAQATTPRAIARPGTVAPVAVPLDVTTVEVIRGDKRAREVVRQE